MSVPGPQHRGRPHRPALGEADRTGVGVLLDPLDLTLCPLPLQIAGVYSHPLPDLPHGTLDLAELERLITRGLGSPYHPVCELICLENTHSSSGGRVLPIEYLRQVGPLPPAAGSLSSGPLSWALVPSDTHLGARQRPELLWEAWVCLGATDAKGMAAPV